MANRDPRQEIIDHLLALRMPKREEPASLSHDWHTTSPRDELKVTRSFHFLKERRVANSQLFVVILGDEQGQEMLFTCYLVQDEQGNWHLRDSLGGRSSKSSILVRSHPWVNLSGGGWPDHFFASGYVQDSDHQAIQRIRLTSVNGTTLEDTVEDGLVAFLTDRKVKLPLRADLYNHDDELVGSHDVFMKQQISWLKNIGNVFSGSRYLIKLKSVR